VFARKTTTSNRFRNGRPDDVSPPSRRRSVRGARVAGQRNTAGRQYGMNHGGRVRVERPTRVRQSVRLFSRSARRRNVYETQARI